MALLIWPSLHQTNALKFGLNHPISPERAQKEEIETNAKKLENTFEGILMLRSMRYITKKSRF